MDCKHCGGSGLCRPCQGRGWISARPDHQTGPPSDFRPEDTHMGCPVCKGTGACRHCTQRVMEHAEAEK